MHNLLAGVSFLTQVRIPFHCIFGFQGREYVTTLLMWDILIVLILVIYLILHIRYEDVTGCYIYFVLSELLAPDIPFFPMVLITVLDSIWDVAR